MTKPTILFLLVSSTILAATTLTCAAESVCFGTTSQGRLKESVILPASGSNFVTYSSLGPILGRTYVHSTVNRIIVESFGKLESSRPATIYMIGETGKKQGGPFKPHKTHQNGLSVDFMAPVINSSGKSVELPTSPLNKFGYNLEFDNNGKMDELHIDFEAIADHLAVLHRTSRKHGVDLWRVIFDPMLQKHLFATRNGEYLRQNIRFSKKRAWVRHDEHYHVDFAIDCEPLENFARENQ